NGPIGVPGHPEKSRLVEAVRYTNVALRMPPKGMLPAAAIQDLTGWVRMGMPMPAENGPTTTASGREAFNLEQRRREHWAWQPLQHREPPSVKNTAWPRSPVDRFILAQLEAKGLVPAPPADKRALLRRVHFDLVGLPPTPAEVEAFQSDSSP